MREFFPAILAGLVLLSAPFVTASDHDGPSDDATYGLCTADDNHDPGDEASNGTVAETSPFENTSEDECQNASHPGQGSGDENASDGEERGDERGNGSNSGDERGSDGDEQSDEGSERRP